MKIVEEWAKMFRENVPHLIMHETLISAIRDEAEKDMQERCACLVEEIRVGTTSARGVLAADIRALKTSRD